MAASYESPTEYINHHLTFLTKPVGTGGDFWTINVDTILSSIFVAVLTFGFLWLVTRKATAGVPSKTQAFVELAFDFVNDQVKSIYHGSSKIVVIITLLWLVLSTYHEAVLPALLSAFIVTVLLFRVALFVRD
jgi:F-type H+-transporting ATPase subunit a